MKERTYEMEKKQRLRHQRDKVAENIIRENNTKGSLYTPLSLEELMNGSKQRVKVIMKDAKKTILKTDCDLHIHNVELFKHGSLGSDADIWRLSDLVDELFRNSKDHLKTLKTIKKYINKNIRSKNYKYAALVDSLLDGVAELDYQLNEYREDTLMKENYYAEPFAYETRDLDFSIETGVRTLVLDKKNNIKA
ncbi:MAG: hypothetical protein PHU94_03660 [Bacilli bacterium]|nr:hypothetical protein [Bacilli bacterium]MDD4734158.1 hypothetical protein [Bacilli bacterium]